MRNSEIYKYPYFISCCTLKDKQPYQAIVWT